MVSPNWGKNKPSQKSLSSKLEVMSMTELRDYVKKHGLKAKDTDKKELISEILKESE